MTIEMVLLTKKHSVEKDVEEFCGYDFLLQLVEKAPDLMSKALISFLFETGGRISEVLALKRSNIDFSQPEVILVKKMPVLKKYRKVGEIEDPSKKSGKRWITEKIEATHTVPILKSSPLSPFIEKWCEDKNLHERLFPITRTTALNWVRRIGKMVSPSFELYPHWFRAQKACQLASEYGYDVFSLKDMRGKF